VEREALHEGAAAARTPGSRHPGGRNLDALELQELEGFLRGSLLLKDAAGAKPVEDAACHGDGQPLHLGVGGRRKGDEPGVPSPSSSKTASGSRTWKWGVNWSAEPKRWTKATAPVWGLGTPSRLAVRFWRATSARTNRASASESSRASRARQKRSGTGKESVHWRYGARGSTRSTRWSAVSCARRALQEGHTPRDLQEKGTSTSARQVRQARRAKP